MDFPPMTDNQPTPGELVGIGAGVVLLIGSFLPFYSFDVDIPGFAGEDWSAWSNDLNLFPLATLVVLLGVATAARIAVNRFGTAPDAAWMRWGEYDLVLGVLASITTLAFIFRDLGDFAVDTGIGAWLMLIGAIALVVSAALRSREATT
jgi:hypothetical protein